MAKKKKIVTIGQLKYRKRQEDMIMKEILDICEKEGILLSKAQLLQIQRNSQRKFFEDHAMRIKHGKNHTKLMKEENKPEP